MKIAIASDHAGFRYKEEIKAQILDECSDGAEEKPASVKKTSKKKTAKKKTVRKKKDDEVN